MDKKQYSFFFVDLVKFFTLEQKCKPSYRFLPIAWEGEESPDNTEHRTPGNGRYCGGDPAITASAAENNSP